jgi:hypothetical protein
MKQLFCQYFLLLKRREPVSFFLKWRKLATISWILQALDPPEVGAVMSLVAHAHEKAVGDRVPGFRGKQAGLFIVFWP